MAAVGGGAEEMGRSGMMMPWRWRSATSEAIRIAKPSILSSLYSRAIKEFKRVRILGAVDWTTSSLVISYEKQLD